MANNTTKNYSEIYGSNLVLGAQVSGATYISPSFSNPPKLQDSPLWNRFWDLTSFNVIQDQLFSRINTNLNIIYLGTLQTAKYLPNLLIQNYMKERLYNEKAGIIMKVSNAFLITSSGMTIFFTIGALESKITDISYKMDFVATILAGSFGYYFYAGMQNELIKAGAINLSLNGAGLVTLGLTGSFIAPYIMHELGIDKGGIFELDKIWLLKLSIIGSTAVLSGGSVPAIITSVILTEQAIEHIDLTGLDKIEILGYNVVNMITLSVVTATKLATENYEEAAEAISRIVAVSFAKANAVTGVEIASDYKETICSYPLIDKACSLLGITEPLAEV